MIQTDMSLGDKTTAGLGKKYEDFYIHNNFRKVGRKTVLSNIEKIFKVCNDADVKLSQLKQRIQDPKSVKAMSMNEYTDELTQIDNNNVDNVSRFLNRDVIKLNHILNIKQRCREMNRNKNLAIKTYDDINQFETKMLNVEERWNSLLNSQRIMYEQYEGNLPLNRSFKSDFLNPMLPNGRSNKGLESISNTSNPKISPISNWYCRGYQDQTRIKVDESTGNIILRHQSLPQLNDFREQAKSYRSQN